MKKKVGVVCGGYSGEAAVSMKSAEMILKNIDRDKFDPIQMVLEPGNWYASIDGNREKIDANDFSFIHENERHRPDLCLIIVHGTPGEDGKLQGYFEMIGMPYTTGGVLNSSLTFNKQFTNDLLRQRGFNTAKNILLHHPDECDADRIVNDLALPVFVKPNRGGSSLGISKVKEKSELREAVEKAYAQKSDVLIEEYLDGREFTCGVICRQNQFQALAVTEIATEREFFDYQAKYTHDQTREITPAELPPELYDECRSMSVKIARSLNCRGVVRIDYKLVKDAFFVIEVNTVPGMTEHSIVPQQAAPLGISKTEIINEMIQTALDQPEDFK